jgi:hypothetical protein
MRTTSVTDDQIRNALEQTNGNATKAASLVGLSPSRMRERRQALGNHVPNVESFEVGARPRTGELVFPLLPSSELPIEQLIDRRIAEYERVRTAHNARKLIDVKVEGDLPIGVVIFGDPHLDDPGTDLAQLRKDSQLINDTPSMYGACIGDLQNNWVGRLAHLYSQQETTSADSWRLTEWWINYVNKWLLMVDGNHDAWSGNGNPLQWIRGLSGRHMIQDNNEARIRLNFSNGAEYIIAARHNWPGNSQWNPAHGEFKAALMRLKAHLIVSGHTHTSLDASLKVEAHDIITRCAKIGSYKRVDRYCAEGGFPDRMISPSIAVVIDPRAKTQTGLSQLFYDIDRAAEYLTFLRKRYELV